MNALYEKALGFQIRQLRENQKFTQNDLASKMQVLGCDITRSAIAKIEVGQRHVYPDELYLIKTILNISFDDLFPPI